MTKRIPFLAIVETIYMLKYDYYLVYKKKVEIEQ